MEKGARKSAFFIGRLTLVSGSKFWLSAGLLFCVQCKAALGGSLDLLAAKKLKLLGVKNGAKLQGFADCSKQEIKANSGWFLLLDP